MEWSKLQFIIEEGGDGNDLSEGIQGVIGRLPGRLIRGHPFVGTFEVVADDWLGGWWEDGAEGGSGTGVRSPLLPPGESAYQGDTCPSEWTGVNQSSVIAPSLQSIVPVSTGGWWMGRGCWQLRSACFCCWWSGWEGDWGHKRALIQSVNIPHATRENTTTGG